MSWAQRIKSMLTSAEDASENEVGLEVATQLAPHAAADRDVIDSLRSEVARESGGRLEFDGIDPDASVYDHGYVDSLSSASLLHFIETRYGVRIMDTELVGRLDTLAKIAAFVEQER